jgi:hypothetical protein
MTRRSSSSTPADEAVVSPKQVREPVWHVGPSGTTTISSASQSQSMRISWMCSTWPEVSPFFQSAFRLRLQKWTRPVSTVRASASALA